MNSKTLLRFSLLIVSQLFLATNLKAQYFGLIRSQPEEYYHTILNYPNDSNYKVLSFRHPAGQIKSAPGQMSIKKYGPNLNIIDSVFFPKGINGLTNEAVRDGNFFFLPGIYCDTLVNDCSLKSDLVILKLDTNYHGISMHKVSSLKQNELGLILTNNLIVTPTFYVLVKQVLTPPNTSYSVVYKLNKQFVKLDSLVFFPGRIQYSLLMNNKINLFGNAYNLPFNLSNYNRFARIVLDSNLVITQVHKLDSLTSYSVQNAAVGSQNLGIEVQNAGVQKISEKKYILVGNSDLLQDFQLSPPSLKYTMAKVISVISNSNQVLSLSVESNSIINNGFVDYKGKIAIQKDAILTVGVQNYLYSSLPYNQTQFTKMVVTKLDTNGNILWTKNHGGDMHYYPESIAFTKDGGCVIAGLRFDSVKSSRPIRMESFLFKLDKNGDFNAVSIIENKDQSASSVICYPNPASKEINLVLPEKKSFVMRVFNSLGQMLMEYKLNQAFNTVSITQLPEGLFSYTLESDKQLYRGKFLKIQ